MRAKDISIGSVIFWDSGKVEVLDKVNFSSEETQLKLIFVDEEDPFTITISSYKLINLAEPELPFI